MGQFSDNYQELRQRQKRARGASYYTRWVNRPWGRVLAAALALTPLTPNAVTWLSAGVSAAGLVVLATVEPSVAVGLAVWFLTAFGFALDSADGQLARLRGGGSRSGEWLDHVIDAGKAVLLHSAVLISWYRFFELPSDAYLLLPLVFQATAVVTFVGGTLADVLLRGDSGHASRPPSRVTSVALLAGDFGVTALAFLLLGFGAVFVAAYAALMLANVALLLLLAGRWFRALSNREAEPGPAL